MAKKEKQDKTQVIRILEQHKLDFEVHTFPDTLTDGEKIAEYLEEDPFTVFKTLVTVSNTKEYFVFVVPVLFNLDLKKAAKVVNVKSVEMIKQKELEPLTGYVHGGCSPLGMKKLFKTVFDESSKEYEKIVFSAGRRGMQVEMNVKDLETIIPIEYANIVM